MLVIAIFRINVRRVVFSRTWITNHVFPFPGCAEANSSADSEIISLAAILRMEGIPALKGNVTRPSSKCPSFSLSIHHMPVDVVDLSPSNVPNRSFPGKLFIFVDNDEVIRMIIQGRRSNLRHLSQTRRVDLD